VERRRVVGRQGGRLAGHAGVAAGRFLSGAGRARVKGRTKPNREQSGERGSHFAVVLSHQSIGDFY
jgi:hypothetical protein